MVLEKPGEALRLEEVPKPRPEGREVLLRVEVCGLCRTDLHVVDGELVHPKLPLVPGHQVVGRVEALGPKAHRVKPGQRLGLPWLGGACGLCPACLRGQENLCENAVFTGYQKDGGMAEYCLADEDFCLEIPPEYPSLQAAPLLCAGLIGYRALRFAGGARVLGFYGFGSSAHILTQVALHQNRRVLAFTRPGDKKAQDFALSLGASWAGGSDQPAPEPLDAALIFAPEGPLVPAALKAVRPGGRVVCAGIHMSPIPAFPYGLLWGERQLLSVANLTRQDGREFMSLAPQVPVRTEVTVYPLDQANQALDDLRQGRFVGSAVLRVCADEKESGQAPEKALE